ncbi:hypothetical protein BC831DRAFT_517349, partial [Entophlyctis helioformis]
MRQNRYVSNVSAVSSRDRTNFFPAETQGPGAGVSTKLVDAARVTELPTVAQYAMVGYCDPIVNQSQWPAFKATGVVTVNDRTKQIVVIFRGSTTADDWIANFTLSSTSPTGSRTARWVTAKLAIPKDAKMHKGFSVDYERTRA